MTINDAALRAELERLLFPDNAADGPREQEDELPPPHDAAPPALPLEVFPEGLRAWAEALAGAMAVPTDYVTAAILGAAAGALGGTFRLELAPGWVEAPRLWVALVGGPGTGKSPVLKRVLAPLWDAHGRAVRAFEEEWKAYEEALAAWERERAEARKGGADPGPRPEPPAKRWLMVNDVTREQLIAVLRDNPPGVVVPADELAGLVKDWARYRDDGGRQFWLSLWSGAAIQMDRKTGGHVYVPQPFAVLVGGIQPAVLKTVAPLDGGDGLLARFLFAYPEPAPVPEAFPPSPDDRPWRAAIERLLHAREGEKVLCLTPAAAERFAELRRWALQEAREEADEALAAVFAKAPSQAARLALVLAALEAAACGASPLDIDAVGEAYVLGAWALVRAFVDHAARALGQARKNEADRRAEALVKWLQRKGGQATPRDVARANVAGITRASEAEAALRDLEDRGYGRFERQGRSRVFRLAQPDSGAVDGVA